MKVGDLVRVIQTPLMFEHMLGITGIVIDDLEHDEVQVYHAGREPGEDDMWWERHHLEVISENR